MVRPVSSSLISKKKGVTVALYAELHRHLGGSVVPRVLWRYFQRHSGDIVSFSDPEFEDFYTRPRNTLDEYLELHARGKCPNCPDFALLYLPLDSSTFWKTWHI